MEIENPLRFPVVCIGGSAGGLDAYKILLKNLPSDMGVAIIIVNHLRQFVTMLYEILPNYMAMPVNLISAGLGLKPNHVFIIPEKRDLHVQNGVFHLEPVSKPRGWPDVITVFMCSLAKHWKGKIIPVIVSGYDGDGADALCAIQKFGGITNAQKLDSAAHPDMPMSAIESGVSISFWRQRTLHGRSFSSHMASYTALPSSIGSRCLAVCLPLGFTV